MSWEYRVTRTTDPDGSHDFAIREVYYGDADTINGWTDRSVGISGTDFQMLTRDLARYQGAFSKSVLAIEPDGLFDIGPMGNSAPKPVWKPRASLGDAQQGPLSPAASEAQK